MKPLNRMPLWYLPLLLGVVTPFTVAMFLIGDISMTIWFLSPTLRFGSAADVIANRVIGTQLSVGVFSFSLLILLDFYARKTPPDSV